MHVLRHTKYVCKPLKGRIEDWILWPLSTTVVVFGQVRAQYTMSTARSLVNW